MKIAVFLGSIREGRTGENVSAWVMEQLGARRDGHDYQLIDLKEQNLPPLTDIPPGAVQDGNYADPATREWSALMGGFEAYLFITPEYNASIPGTMKNAFDLIFHEWAGKPVGFVSYGGGAGRGAVSHWRDIVTRARMIPVEPTASFSFREHFPERVFTPGEEGNAALGAVIDAMEAAAE